MYREWTDGAGVYPKWKLAVGEENREKAGEGERSLSDARQHFTCLGGVLVPSVSPFEEYSKQRLIRLFGETQPKEKKITSNSCSANSKKDIAALFVVIIQPQVSVS